ncbi:hypothetical protein [Streptomyces longispororuber]|uniref:hypothetical protein n=1 Tax=Streptomyces longispororuber TaxID=68230 RepID=UPI002109B690|nr:hypothetical protein [Streptomyces longispororuber]MCQ4205600.1 hypothetical protein [Streptomyces longispororuber]
MNKTIVWLLACAGTGVIVWLLTSPPDLGSSYPRSECRSILGSERGPARGSMEDGVDATCASYQNRRLGWAVLVSLPTVVLASAGMRRSA